MDGFDFDPPDAPNPAGTILESDSQGKRVGIWIMPNNTSSGMLENFLSEIVPDSDPCKQWAQDATDKAKELGAPIKNLHLPKAYIHTWLAWQENPGLPFGTAIHARYFDANHELAKTFVDWFLKVFRD